MSLLWLTITASMKARTVTSASPEDSAAAVKIPNESAACPLGIPPDSGVPFPSRALEASTTMTMRTNATMVM